MSTRTSWVLVLCLAMAAWGILPGTAAAEETAPPPAKKKIEFDTFRILIDRNIFSGTRNVKNDAAQPANAGPDPSRIVRLQGTWLDDNRTIALFDGAGASLAQPLKCGDSVAESTIEAIQPDGVTLRNESGVIRVPVGGTLVKGEDGKWTVVSDLVRPDAPPKGASAAGDLKPGDDNGDRPRRRRRKESGL